MDRCACPGNEERADQVKAEVNKLGGMGVGQDITIGFLNYSPVRAVLGDRRQAGANDAVSR